MDCPGVIMLSLFVAWAASAVCTLIAQYRLYQYLQEHYYDRWLYLTSGPFWGAVGANSFRGIPYIYGDQDNDDSTIVALKGAVKRSLFCALCVFCALLLMVLAVVVFVLLLQK